ncbi:MAG: AI-2E family transporter [Bacteroidales bacterium]|nr:AI-2E family transporter [Bacteroidales bacterium]
MNNYKRYIFIGVVVLIVAAIAWYFKKILAFLIISAVISMIGKPIVRYLRKIRIGKHKIPGSLASLLTLVLISGVILSLFLLLAPMFAEVVTLVNNIDINSIGAKIDEPLKQLNDFITETFPSVGEDFTIESYLFNYFRSYVDLSMFSNLVSSITSFLVDLFIYLFSVLFISFFMLRENGLIVNTITSIFADKYEDNIRKASAKISNLLSRYFIGISIESLGIALLNSLGLIFIAGMDTELAIVVATVSGILNIIPYVGPLIGDVIAVTMGFVYYYNVGVSIPLYSFLGIILAVFVVTQLVDNYLFQPIIYSNSVKSHPLEIFLVILIAGQIGGVLGILAAIPAYTVIRVILGEFVPHLKFVQKLMSPIQEK